MEKPSYHTGHHLVKMHSFLSDILMVWAFVKEKKNRFPMKLYRFNSNVLCCLQHVNSLMEKKLFSNLYLSTKSHWLQSHLLFLDLLLFSSKESTDADLLLWTALTKTLPDATRSLWRRRRVRSVRLSWWSCRRNWVLSLEILAVLMSASRLKKQKFHQTPFYSFPLLRKHISKIFYRKPTEKK